MKSLQLIISVSVLVAGLAAVPAAQASGPDCGNQTSRAVKTICANKKLMELEAGVEQAFEEAISAGKPLGISRDEHLSWRQRTHDRCKDAGCLEEEYKKRFDALAATLDKEKTTRRPRETVIGRCRMNTCWWYGYDGAVEVKGSGKAKLYKVSARSTEIPYSDHFIENFNYPDVPEIAVWGAPEDIYILCSERLPAVMWFEEDLAGYSVNIPFDSEGNFSGVTEGISHLYRAVCGIPADRKVRSGVTDDVGPLKNPMDAFDLADY
jgi:uncharacterized protein